MFQMIVEDAIRLGDNLISVAGACNNRLSFKTPVLDEAGNAYDAHIPFVVEKVPDNTRVVLGITGSYDAKSFIGKTLVSA